MTPNEAQIQFECKICKAKPGQPCINQHGVPIGGVHAFGCRGDLDAQFRKLTRNEEVDK